ncbi:Essential recombination function protein [uncultured Caudovirales phage]|uniref:Essential recombination function protein n=1 Tax=uncultured Caudovirales phage TaxID=2100421 RepID=A0A6J7WF86_9CAUD|nr:Essential recombination function protein [uncultured Caudovirales phage]
MNNDYQLQEQHEQQQWIVYSKLQKARVLLQEQPLKKSGFNSFAGFKYFELADFLPTINVIFDNLGLCSVFTISNGIATLRIIDSKYGGLIYFCSPIADAASGKAPPIQALGSMHTYLRRYLFLNALEITEHDAVDATIKKDEPKSAKPITVDVFDSLDAKTQELIEDIAMDVRMLLQKNDLQGAIDYITLQELDADSKTAFWSRLDSKERSAIKKFSTGK